MSAHYPRIRHYSVYESGRYLSIRESVGITFYMRHPHQEVARRVLHTLEVYRRAVGPGALGCYLDEEGEWRNLDDEAWKRTRQDLLYPSGANVQLGGASDDFYGYAFTYYGEQFDATRPSNDKGVTCMVAFWLPTEYLEEHGPAQVRELALELAAELPFNSGHAGLSLLFPEAVLGMAGHIRDVAFRYPGLDIPDQSICMDIGTRVKGAHWLTFLGQPVLGRLGGAAGLRARLLAPDTSVQQMEGERALVTLGKWPEAGDLEQGQTLPEYRELARQLEPWLYERQCGRSGFSLEDIRRWERRFLD
ncbi:DUF3396 domain-containing protein [Archangium violaceum]|uniref:type VI immunity family protein n=1 Tax=Archangium violaceum TaxID=83451 RepID=UPI001950C9B9|nr:type VI immunity family protein [Archangium violaceum]QRN95579.1 DUF3396 domain-containing protein [Archangium violaceum]